MRFVLYQTIDRKSVFYSSFGDNKVRLEVRLTRKKISIYLVKQYKNLLLKHFVQLIVP